jgi:hypothetical protein
MPRARHQEWLRVHLEGLPERQRAREQARREKAPRRRNQMPREPRRWTGQPRAWGARLDLRLRDVWAEGRRGVA